VANAPQALDEEGQMGKTSGRNLQLSQPVASGRSQGEVLRDIKVALATGNNYGRQARQQGFDPYDSRLGRTPRDVWGRKTP
jgi:hypothetical protein